MSETRLPAAGWVAFAVGFIAVGFALGYYYVASSFDPGPAPQPQPEVRCEVPRYDGTRPRAEFPTSREPAAAATLAAAESWQAILEVLRERDPFARTSSLASLLATLGPEAVPVIPEVLRTQPDLDGVAIFLLVRFWASQDPASAARWAMFRASPAYRRGANSIAFEEWGRVDPAGAEEQIQAALLVQNVETREAERALVRGWFASGLPGLEDYLRDLGLGFRRQRALDVFVRLAVQRDGPEAIARWAEAISDQDRKFKLDVFRRVAMKLVRADPALAVAWCDAHCDGPFGDGVRTAVAHGWATRTGDGPAAMQWVSTAPAGQARDLAARGAFEGWLSHDRDGLYRWMNETASGGVEPWLQPVLELAANAILAREPAEAMKWVAHIDDEAVRERVYVMCARKWRMRDESAAEAWIEQSPLSASAREQARTPLGGTPVRPPDPVPERPAPL
jgi:hypothetical protein